MKLLLTLLSLISSEQDGLARYSGYGGRYGGGSNLGNLRYGGNLGGNFGGGYRQGGRFNTEQGRVGKQYGRMRQGRGYGGKRFARGGRLNNQYNARRGRGGYLNKRNGSSNGRYDARRGRYGNQQHAKGYGKNHRDQFSQDQGYAGQRKQYKKRGMYQRGNRLAQNRHDRANRGTQKRNEAQRHKMGSQKRNEWGRKGHANARARNGYQQNHNRSKRKSNSKSINFNTKKEKIIDRDDTQFKMDSGNFEDSSDYGKAGSFSDSKQENFNDNYGKANDDKFNDGYRMNNKFSDFSNRNKGGATAQQTQNNGYSTTDLDDAAAWRRQKARGSQYGNQQMFNKGNAAYRTQDDVSAKRNQSNALLKGQVYDREGVNSKRAGAAYATGAQGGGYNNSDKVRGSTFGRYGRASGNRYDMGGGYNGGY